MSQYTRVMASYYRQAKVHEIAINAMVTYGYKVADLQHLCFFCKAHIKLIEFSKYIYIDIKLTPTTFQKL